jgi:hypothetical protein
LNPRHLEPQSGAAGAYEALARAVEAATTGGRWRLAGALLAELRACREGPTEPLVEEARKAVLLLGRGQR